MARTGSLVADRQHPLRGRYATRPSDAVSVKRVRSVHAAARDPFHGAVEVVGDYPESLWTFGLDATVAGDDDLPNPGHLLCAALAACQDNVIRMIANHLGIELTHLEVAVTGRVDVRGCLGIDHEVRVGFSDIDVAVSIAVAPDTDDHLVQVLQDTSERLCVNLDTLRRGVPVTVSYRHAPSVD